MESGSSLQRALITMLRMKHASLPDGLRQLRKRRTRADHTALMDQRGEKRGGTDDRILKGGELISAVPLFRQAAVKRAVSGEVAPGQRAAQPRFQPFPPPFRHGRIFPQPHDAPLKLRLMCAESLVTFLQDSKRNCPGS